jgi:ribulose-5-phosphate 4-epimerase/fuculose-1-phosphate aldolase
VNHAGDVVVGERPVNEAAFAIHSQIHLPRPGVEAAAHSHSLYGKALSSRDKRIDPIRQDACGDHEGFRGLHRRSPRYRRGQTHAHGLGTSSAVILRNHGLPTVGSSVDEAAWWFIAMERPARRNWFAEAAGKPTHIDHETAARTSARSAGRTRVGPASSPSMRTFSASSPTSASALTSADETLIPAEEADLFLSAHRRG